MDQWPVWLGCKLVSYGSLKQVPSCICPSVLCFSSLCPITARAPGFYGLLSPMAARITISYPWMQGLNPEVRLPSDRRTGQCVPALSPAWPSPSLGPALEQQKEQENGSWARDGPNPKGIFRQHLQETLLGAVGAQYLSALSPGDKDKCLFPDVGLALCWAGLWECLLLQGYTMAENIAHFSHVFQNYIDGWLPLLGLVTDCMKMKSNSVFGQIHFLLWSLHDLLEDAWVGKGKLSWGKKRREKSNRLYTQPIPPLFFEGEQL